MSSEIWNPGSSASAAQPADDSEDSSAEQPASLCLFARLPPEIWRQLIGLLSYSDVAACSGSTSHEDTKRLLMEYMRRRCCISTFKRLLVEHGAIMRDPDYGEQWDPDFWNMELSCGVLFASDVDISQPLYVVIDHLFIQRELQRQFRAGYGAPNHFEQPWFTDYDYPRVVFEMS